MDELKGCPFCDGGVDVTSCSVNAGKRIVKGTFVCNKCGAKISLTTKYENAPITSLDEAWNRRANDGN